MDACADLVMKRRFWQKCALIVVTNAHRRELLARPALSFMVVWYPAGSQTSLLLDLRFGDETLETKDKHSELRPNTRN